MKIKTTTNYEIYHNNVLHAKDTILDIADDVAQAHIQNKIAERVTNVDSDKI